MRIEAVEKTQILIGRELIKVLLVEDDELDRRLAKRIFARCTRPIKFIVELAGTLSTAVEYLGSREYNIVLLDLGLPDSSGIGTVQKVSEVNPHIPIVVLTGLDDEEMGLLAIKNGATDYLVKGLTLNNLLVRTVLYALERKKTEEELREANEKLKEYDQLKSEFVSMTSHELRTPLSIIMGAIKLVLDEIPGKIMPEQRDVLTTAMENVERLSNIVDSLLNISKIESGKLDLQTTSVNICELIENTVSDYKPLAEERGIHLDCELPRESLNISLDPDKTRQVLINLVSNSLEFTPEGGWVKVICSEQDEEVQICVQDSGVGVAKEDIPKLFDKFTQFGRKAGLGEKGTGLGLAISKGMVKLWRGRIWAESEAGKGSKFTFTLPK